MKDLLFKILVLCVVLLTGTYTHAQRIITFAGNHTAGYSGDGGAATAAALSTPESVATDGAGNIYITDADECVVRKVDRYGVITTIAGNGTPGYGGDNGPATSAMLNTPYAIAIDGAGNIYIADNGNLVVRKVDPTGTITTIAGTTIYGATGDGGPAISATLQGATGIATDTKGNIYVSDGNSCVRRIDDAGNIHTYAGNSSISGYSGDHAVATGANLDGPIGLATDDTGNLYIADNQNNVIRRVDTFGIITTIAGNGDFAGLGAGGFSGDGGPATLAELHTPTGVCIDKKGDLFIADRANHIIRRVNASGTISTLAGIPETSGYSGDGGPALNANLNYPSGTATDTAGNLYIADSHNSAVRKVQAISLLTNTGDTICHGTQVTFYVASTVDDTSVIYQWRKNGMLAGPDSASYISNTIQNGDTVSCTVLHADSSVIFKDSVAMAWRGLPSGMTISTSPGDTVCAGMNVTFTIAPDDLSYTYTWLKNGVVFGTGVTANYNPSNSDSVICAVSSSAGCGASAPIVMSVRVPSPPSVYIDAPGGLNVCAGSTVTLSASSSYGGPSPSYIWEVNGDTITATSGSSYTYMPADGDMVNCIMMSDDACRSIDTAASNVLTIDVLPTVTPMISIALAGSDTVCAGTPVTLSAAAVNGGSAPSFQWYKNGIGEATDTPYTFVPVDGDVVYCRLTSSACASPASVTSNSVTLSVTPMATPGITVIAPSDTVCAGTVVTYTITDTNAGTSPSFLWKVNGLNVSSASSYSFTPANGDIIACVMTSDANCLTTTAATSEGITMVVNAFVTPTVTISTASAYTVCAGAAVSYTATAVNGGATPAYQWAVNGSNTTTGSAYTYTPANGDVVTCTLTGSAQCATAGTATSNTLTMTVNPAVTPSVNISAVGGFTLCSGTTVTYTATPVNGGSSPAYQWKVNGVDEGTGNTYSYTPANGDIVSCILTSNAPCASGIAAANVTMTVTTASLPTVSISTTSSSPLCAGVSVSYTATPVNGGTTPTYQWRVNGMASGTGATHSYTPADGDLVTCVLTSNATCVAPDTAVSNVITMTVTPSVLPSVSTAASTAGAICAGTMVTYTATPENGGTAPTYQWKVNGVNEGSSATYTYAPAESDAVTCVVTSNATCAVPDTAISTAITMTVTPITTPMVNITASPGTIVTTTGEIISFVATVTNGGTTPAYQWEINGVAIPGATASVFAVDTFTTNDTVSCIVTSDAPCVTTATANSNHLGIQISLGINQLSAIQNIVLLPNPNNGSFAVKGTLGDGAGATISYDVTDMLGRIVYTRTEPVLQKAIDTPLLLGNDLPGGVYLLHISSGNSNSTVHFVLQK